MSWLTDQRRVLIGRAMAIVSIAVSIVAFGLYLTLASGEVYAEWVVHAIVGAVVFAVLGWLIIGAQPRNRAVWLLLWMALFQAVNTLGIALMREVTERLDLAPLPIGVPVADLGLIGSIGAILGHAAWIPGIAPLVTLGLLWFPDGRLPSSRWRPVEWLAIAATAGFTLSRAWRVHPFGATFDPDLESFAPAESAFFAAIGLAVVLSVAGLVVRYRGSGGEVRRQVRWVVWASGTMAGLWLAANALDAVVTGHVAGPTFQAVSLVSMVFWLGAYAIAIWRHQLLDVDVVISRTLLFGLLAAFIGLVYVGVVFGIGTLIGQQSGDDRTLALAATVVVAFLFHPVRQRLERAANRLVYGRRATPYEVLADLSGRLARTESTDGLLDRMASLVAEGTGAERSIVWQWSDPGYEPLAVWPPGTPVEPCTELSEGDMAVPIERAGRRLGALTLTKRRGEELNPTEQRLLDDLAGSAALVLDRARLDAALADQAAALFQSRRRLVGAQDEERQRLEQSLLTGTHQQLDRLAAKLDANAELATGQGLAPADDQLIALAAEARAANDEIQALARGVYPPVLEADGLTAAVESLAASLPITVQVKAIDSHRSELDIELAVYFCIAEALTNIVKHAQATTTSVRLDHTDQLLSFEVADDGIGMPSTTRNGSSTGLSGLSDRIEAVGGQLAVTSTRGHGTTISGSVAINAPVRIG
ncbi:MAG: ATP-binding protein [Acidimicrobiales bacterium]